MGINKPYSVVIADDHKSILDDVQYKFEKYPEIVNIVGVAKTTSGAYDLVIQKKANILITDLAMEGMPALIMVEKLVKEAPDTKILIYTAHDELSLAYTFRKAGAHGFLGKEEGPEWFIEAIESIMISSNWISPIYQKYLVDHDMLEEFEIRGDKLTKREIEVISYVINGDSNNEIAKKLFISEGTVKYHLNNILRKLHVKNRTEAALFAREKGGILGIIV
jgi:DNA-binding NarL/FixJ family response regulator